MPAVDARPVPRKNTAFRAYFAMRKNDGTLVTGWTGADSEVSIDGGTFADCTNEATEIGTSGVGYVDLTASEMNGDAVVYKLTLTNTGALPLVIAFYPEEQGDYRVDPGAVWAAALTLPGQAAPSNMPTAESALAFLYKLSRNKIESTATETRVFDDAGTTVDHKATVSDNGTTFTRNEFGAGP
jgi:hypothetical protein